MTINKKIFTIIAIFFLTLNFAIQAGSNQIKNHETMILQNDNYIYVDDDNTQGPWDGTDENPYQTITQALENSAEDDIIFVHQGEYKENLEINKHIQLIGENKKNTIIDGDYQGDVIKISANNVLIQGFCIKNSQGDNDNSGILSDADSITIMDCLIYRCRHGILLKNSEESLIIHCFIHTNGEGVYFDNCIDCNIKESEIYHNAIGTHACMSNNILFKKSYFHENGIGLFINHSEDIEINEIGICDNNNNQGGCFVFNSKEILITNTNVVHNGLAVRFDDSDDIKIEKSTFKFNAHYAIYIKKNTYNVTVTKCDIHDNLRNGICVNNGECTAEYNNIIDNFIDGVHVNQGSCNACNNYWGSKYGPFLKGIRLVDLLVKKGEMKLIPWLYEPVSETGSDWTVEERFVKKQVTGYGDDQIELPGEDTDEDGIPDWWETQWGYDPLVFNDHENIDEDEDALNNFEECYTSDYGSSPFKKDVFIEVDWMETGRASGIENRPSEEYINEMKDRFAEHDITLHVDIGNLDGGEEIPYESYFNYDGLIDIYWDYFLHNDLNNPRKNIFHYALICDQGAGAGFEFIGWAHSNGVCISSEILKLVYPEYTHEWLIIVGIMHEIGHTFGLFSDDFNGNDNRAAIKPYYKDFWEYHSYKSIMNYQYFLKILDYSDGNNGKYDFDDWNNLDYDFFKNTDFNWPLE